RNGTLSHNDNEVWDDSEYDIYTVELFEDEYLEVELVVNTPYNFIYLELYEGEDNIREAQNAVINENYLEFEISHEFENTVSFSYDTTSDVVLRIAVLSVGSDFDFSNYELTSNIPFGSRNSGTSPLAIIIIVVFVIIIIILVVNSNNKKKNMGFGYNTQRPANYNQSQQQFGYNQPSTSTFSQQGSGFCSNCGTAVKSKFCTSCGHQAN
ncbi:MAG: zinc ribbon domain-containing protein, partial [Candidatus Heimdallarchaeota archaeon]|nr:zinc ribbon domain-containing protein [Candidatus Heimdallarchaeota archaeon]